MSASRKGWIIFFAVLCVLSVVALATIATERGGTDFPAVHISVLISSLLCLRSTLRNNPLPEVCQKQYAGIIGSAFTRKGQRADFRRLVSAVTDFDRSRYDRSLKKLRKLELRCKHDSDFAAVYAFTGLSHAKLKNYPQAERFYRNSLAYNPMQDRILANLCAMLSNMNRYEEAVEIGKLAVECNKMNPTAHNNLAYSLLHCLRYGEAIHYALKARELNERIVAPVHTLCIAHLMLCNTEQSDEYYDLALSMGTDRDTLDRSIEYHKKRAEAAGASKRNDEKQ